MEEYLMRKWTHGMTTKKFPRAHELILMKLNCFLDETVKCDLGWR